MDHPAGIDLQYCGQISVILLQNRPLYIDKYFPLVLFYGGGGLKKWKMKKMTQAHYMTRYTAWSDTEGFDSHD